MGSDGDFWVARAFLESALPSCQLNSLNIQSPKCLLRWADDIGDEFLGYVELEHEITLTMA